jgi:hypothetical protein
MNPAIGDLLASTGLFTTVQLQTISRFCTAVGSLTVPLNQTIVLQRRWPSKQSMRNPNSVHIQKMENEEFTNARKV